MGKLSFEKFKEFIKSEEGGEISFGKLFGDKTVKREKDYKLPDQEFIKEFNENKVSEEFLESCKKSSNLFNNKKS